MKLVFKPFKHDPRRARVVIDEGCKEQFAFVEWHDPVANLWDKGIWQLRELTWLTCANEEHQMPGTRGSVTPHELIQLGEFLLKQKPPKPRRI